MPVKVTVGLSRKLTEDFNSKGFDLHIEAELPANLIEDPNGMATATNGLFQLAEDLLAEQVRKSTDGGSPEAVALPSRNDRPEQPRREKSGNTSNGNHNGNGSNGHTERSHHRQDRPVTEAQKRAITNMAKRLDMEGDPCAHEEFGVPVRELSLKQGSQLIDLLKKQIEAAKEPAGATR